MKFVRVLAEVVGHVAEDGLLTINLGYDSSSAPTYIEFEGAVWKAHEFKPDCGSNGQDLYVYKRVEHG